MQIAQPVEEDIWWEIARKCEYATFFHTPLWHRLATEALSQYEDSTIGIVFDDGVRAILPLLTENKLWGGLGRAVHSSFAGCYGNLIADGPVTAEKRKLIVNHVYSPTLARLRIADNPLFPQSKPEEKLIEEQDFTHILSLDSSFDTIFANFSKGHRSSFRKGERMNVIVRLASSLDEYHAYFGAYQDSLRRWGDEATSEYPWELFEQGFHLAHEYPDNMKLWLALVNEQVIAGAWVFYWNQHVDWWHGAAYASFFDHYPNNVLQTHIIRDALENGYKFYDLNPSGGHENVARFKGRFGAHKWPLKRWKYQNRAVRWGRRARSLLSYGE